MKRIEKKHWFSLFGICIYILLTGCNSSTPSYLIGIDPSWHPLDLSGKEMNVLAFSNELLQEIADEQKIKISTVQMSWDNLIPGLQDKRYDAILYSMRPYNFNQKTFQFSELYLQTGPVLVVAADSKIKSLDKLDGKEIAVIEGSKDEVFLEPKKGVLIRTYDSIPNALNAVVNGTLDGALIDYLAAKSYTQDLYSKQLKIVTQPLDDEGLRLIALRTSPSDLIEAFDHGLERLKKNGTYQKLIVKWGF